MRDKTWSVSSPREFVYSSVTRVEAVSRNQVRGEVFRGVLVAPHFRFPFLEYDTSGGKGKCFFPVPGSERLLKSVHPLFGGALKGTRSHAEQKQEGDDSRHVTSFRLRRDLSVCTGDLISELRGKCFTSPSVGSEVNDDHRSPPEDVGAAIQRIAVVLIVPPVGAMQLASSRGVRSGSFFICVRGGVSL